MAGFGEVDGLVVASDITRADRALQAAGALGVASGEEGGAGGGALRAVGVVLGEACAVGGKLVDVRGLGLGVSVASEVSVAEIVGEEEHDVGRLGSGCCGCREEDGEEVPRSFHGSLSGELYGEFDGFKKTAGIGHALTGDV